MLSSDPLYVKFAFSTRITWEEFQALQLIVLGVFGVWMLDQDLEI